MASVLAVVRLCRAVAYPCLAKLRARLRPITPSPVTPICALAWAAIVVLVSLRFLVVCRLATLATRGAHPVPGDRYGPPYGAGPRHLTLPLGQAAPSWGREHRPGWR